MYAELFVPIALVLLLEAHTCCRLDPRRRAATDAATVQAVAQAYVVDHPGEPCPSLQTLIDHHEIDRSSMRTDPWSHPYRIECTNDEVDVSSAGKDGKFGTADDIVIAFMK